MLGRAENFTLHKLCLQKKRNFEMLGNPLKLKEDLLLDMDKNGGIVKGKGKTRVSGKNDMIL